MIDDSAAPTLRQFLGEAAAFGEWVAGVRGRRAIIRSFSGGLGRPVLVIPGFLAHDILTRPLRATLADAGYHVEGWGLGLNWGVTPELIALLERKLRTLADEHGAVAIVGWSLGGLYARELARRHPDLVDRVVTLGSPFSGDPRANRAWKLYERVNGHPVDPPPIAVVHATKPPVPTTAIWSRRDGIVAPACARGLAEEADRQVEVDCTHRGFVRSPHAFRAVLAALS